MKTVPGERPVGDVCIAERARGDAASPERAAPDRMPRMLALVTEAYGGRGGIAQFNRDLFAALRTTGLVRQIDILPRLAADAPGDGRLGQRPPRYGRVRYSAASLAAALHRRPGLVLNGHLFHGPLALRLARLFGARLVSVVHGTEVWEPLAQRHAEPLRASDLVICVSEDTRRRLLERLGGAPMPRIEVLHNTVRDRFRPGDRQAARRRFALDDRPVVLTVGRLDARDGYKGHDRVIAALGRLCQAGRPVRYLIAGEGADRPRLERLARQAGLADIVTFLGYVPEEALPDLYRAADVFALPSTGEGFGIVFLEAMACGTRAIGLDEGGAPEALAAFGCAVPGSAFAGRLAELIGIPAPDPGALSSAVHARFGRPRFEARAAEFFAGLSAGPAPP